ncbi:MAG: hypothetical protein ACKVGW_19385, partial [Verrucomicrobiia bacterium]
ITETQLLKTILTELGEEGSSRSRSGLVKQVNDILLDKIQQGKDILLIIDESHVRTARAAASPFQSRDRQAKAAPNYPDGTAGI